MSFIIDTIGILTKIYSYADIAYVGGGFGNPGVHNVLEPATFGVPILVPTIRILQKQSHWLTWKRVW
jgi:3-deoxy-D-manno-octulosonic-acid transferase